MLPTNIPWPESVTGRGVLRRPHHVPAIRTRKPQSTGVRTSPLTSVGRPATSRVLRLRALLAQALGAESGYRNYRDRYRAMATSLGFEGHMKWAEAMPC
jgi:hypothetical protein